MLRAVDIAAPPPVVFRWLCQLKVAPYSYDWIDNGGRRSPRTLTPGVEHVVVGERLQQIFQIVEFQPDRHLTVAILPRAGTVFGPLVLTYQVTPAGSGGTRLVACLDHTARTRLARLRSDLLAVGDLVMMRKQLLTLKELAERSAAGAAQAGDPRRSA
jgi:hypothetical protein